MKGFVRALNNMSVVLLLHMFRVRLVVLIRVQFRIMSKVNVRLRCLDHVSVIIMIRVSGLAHIQGSISA